VRQYSSTYLHTFSLPILSI